MLLELESASDQQVASRQLEKPEKWIMVKTTKKKQQNLPVCISQVYYILSKTLDLLLRIYKLYSQRGIRSKLFFVHLIACMLLCNLNCIFSYIVS